MNLDFYYEELPSADRAALMEGECPLRFGHDVISCMVFSCSDHPINSNRSIRMRGVLWFDADR